MISASPKNYWLAKDTLRVLGRTVFSPRLALTYESFGDGMYAAASVVIGTGAYIGKMSPDQILVIGFIQVFAYVINRWLCLRYLIGAFDDNGGSCTIHVFGAFFGLFVSKFGSNKDADNNPDNSSRYNSDIFSIVGSIMMWLTFPSFNGFMAPTQARSAVMVNTLLALISGAVCAYVFSGLANHDRFLMFDIARSTIAGGVAISSIANMLVPPYVAMIIGLLGALGCGMGHRYVQSKLKSFGFIDTCGIFNLHGIPGIIAFICGVISISSYDSDLKNLPFALDSIELFQHRKSGDLAIAQVYMLLLTIALASTFGSVSGYLASRGCLNSPSVAESFSDKKYWIVPTDFEFLSSGAKSHNEDKVSEA